MSLPTKSRTLPAWADVSIPTHARPVGGKPNDKVARHEGGSFQRESEDDNESIASPKAAGAVSDGKTGTKPPFLEFANLMEGVIFSISGLVNPERTQLRNMALGMGAQFRPKWADDCTLLVCPIANTPTFVQAQASGGTIVHKDWIAKCYNEKKLVAIEMYLLHVGKPWRAGFHDSTDFDKSCAEPLANHNSGSNAVKPVPTKGHGNPGRARMNQTAPVLVKHVASPVDVQQWVLEDLAATLTYLEQQSDKPEEYELETVAAQGLLVCLEDAVKSLQENKGLSMVMDNWAFIPKAVKELAAYEKGGQFSKDHLVAEGERFKVIYESQLKKLGFGVPLVCDGGSRAASARKHENHAMTENLRQDLSGETEKDIDDDMTEIISDVDSRDAADFDSDNTVELTEDEVNLCKEKILLKFSLN